MGESPYNYCHNSPLNHIDPDGRFANWLGGAIIGAGMDYLCQVAVNKLEGKTWGESLTKVDLKSIGVSAVTGAVGAGLAPKIAQLEKLVKYGKLAKVVANAAIDGGANIIQQVASNGKVDLKQTGVAIVTGAAVNGAISTKASKSTAVKIAEREADRAAKIAVNNSRPGKIAAANAKQEKLDFLKEIIPQYKTSTITPLVNKAYETHNK